MDGYKSDSLDDFVIKPTEPLFKSNAEPIDLTKHPNFYLVLYEIWQECEKARERVPYVKQPDYIN